jgi:hypothetical protein
MNEQAVFELIKNWGYYPLAKPHPGSPGHTGLLVAIRREPSGKHFDPQTLHLRLRDEYGGAGWKTLSWLSPLEGVGHACPGMITLQDQSGNLVEFFTFGGSLEMTSGPGEMIYSLSSPAPVLEMTTPEETVPDQLAAEVEELWARIEVKWGKEEKEFSRRLAEVDPLQFYLSALASILNHYEQVHVLEEAHHEFFVALRREREWLVEKHLWPTKPLALEDLLAPS